MRYTTFAAARKWFEILNRRQGFAPTAIYFSDEHDSYTLISAWTHGDRKGLTLVLTPST
jgi:hypothetical protein